MEKQLIYDFLSDLSANNSKEWMHANKKRYQQAKNIWLAEIGKILDRLSQYEPSFAAIEPKKTILRITNNRRFHPDKPLYRDNFGCAPVANMFEPSFYIHISPTESFIGGGLHRPPKENLEKVRAAVDYDGERLKALIQTDEFQHFYGGFSHDPHMLKSSPRAYSVDHPHIDLLRRKSFTAIRPLSQAEFVAEDFVDLAEQAYLTVKPFNDYFKQAIEFEMA
ncbi:MAG: DUF2461 domain-containing protein [Bacteroidota bacterium]